MASTVAKGRQKKFVVVVRLYADGSSTQSSYDAMVYDSNCAKKGPVNSWVRDIRSSGDYVSLEQRTICGVDYVAQKLASDYSGRVVCGSRGEYSLLRIPNIAKLDALVTELREDKEKYYSRI